MSASMATSRRPMEAPTQHRPVVAHAMHAYLAPTETFVHHQITSLTRYRPVVVAHHRRPETETRLDEGLMATEALPAPLALMQRGGYRVARVALPAGVARLADYLRDREARILHYHFMTDARFLLGLARRTGLPAVASAYGYDVTQFPAQYRGLGRRYLRPTFDRLDRVLAMSDDMRRDLLAIGCPASKIEVHYHGVPTARFRHAERRYDHGRPLVVLCCGRLTRYKGQHLVLEALRRLERNGHRDVRLVFVGDGSARPGLERTAAERGWNGGRVVFAGHVPHASDALVEHYRAADVFVLPSVTLGDLKEGIPGTIVEAMASGLPVVATRHAGIPAVIESGRDGLLVDEYDVDGLASALHGLLTDPAERARLGQAAADRAARELDLQARTANLERIYDRLL
jgi:colanic acid/amylovoran biosynthesis glycosyltransferase